MKACLLKGPGNMVLGDIDEPGNPGPGEVLVEVLQVGICGSDLHMYETGMIGRLKIGEAFVLGHEFSGRILETGEGAQTEAGEPLQAGMRVAVDPHVACGHCECCREGNPNLCPHHVFHGVPPTAGALCERMRVRAGNCHPLPDDISDATGALLEPLGVALHSLDLGKIRLGDTVAVVGCGPIGLLIGRLAVLAGAARVFACDLLPWRVSMAAAWGMEARATKAGEAAGWILQETHGRGVDVAVEAAWGDQSVRESIEAVRFGGRVVLAGIPADDRLTLVHSEARRKGLTLRFVRRMKHTYRRAMVLAGGDNPVLPVETIITDTFPLGEAPRAFAETAEYREGLVKAMVKR